MKTDDKATCILTVITLAGRMSSGTGLPGGKAPIAKRKKRMKQATYQRVLPGSSFEA